MGVRHTYSKQGYIGIQYNPASICYILSPYLGECAGEGGAWYSQHGDKVQDVRAREHTV